MKYIALKKEEDERARAEQMALLNAAGGQSKKSTQRTGRAEREKKKKTLQARRKALNVDHMEKEGLVNKVQEFHAYLSQLIEERFDDSYFK